ncbi:porin [Shewanella sp. UCD-KL21]|uniref:porin n=1 Tax=Shewanella sp. UCD-KL21 TaxID=1917164 RepID=UPI00097042B3|nr:porin [Shewanella sp. UCD-KL21]
MSFNLKALPLAISVAMLPALAVANDATDEKLAKLEQQVKSLQKQQTANLADKFNFNGFISVGYLSANNSAGYNNATTSANFEEDSKLGFQGTFNISDQTQAVMQLMMRGENDWDVEAEWAYISHRFDNGIQARAGKLRVPLFMYSDYLDIGYAQPFARPPLEVYGQIPFSSYTGGDISYDVEFDDSTLTLQGFGGQSEAEEDVALLDFSNLVGANLSWTDLTWTLRAVYGQASLEGYLKDETGSPIMGIDDEKATFTGVGASYDNGSFLAATEWTAVKVDGLLADTESAYLTVGYRIESFTPYVTVAYLKTTDEDFRSALPPQIGVPLGLALNRERTAYSLGLRWDAIDNVALKFDVTYANDFGDTGGDLESNDYNPLTGEFMYDSTTVYSVKIDAVF